jgi:hypothetical protein
MISETSRQSAVKSSGLRSRAHGSAAERSQPSRVSRQRGSSCGSARRRAPPGPGRMTRGSRGAALQARLVCGDPRSLCPRPSPIQQPAALRPGPPPRPSHCWPRSWGSVPTSRPAPSPSPRPPRLRWVLWTSPAYAWPAIGWTSPSTRQGTRPRSPPMPPLRFSPQVRLTVRRQAAPARLRQGRVPGPLAVVSEGVPGPPVSVSLRGIWMSRVAVAVDIDRLSVPEASEGPPKAWRAGRGVALFPYPRAATWLRCRGPMTGCW